MAPRSAAYYCTPEAAGGVRYDDRLKKWTAANFQPGKPFVLKLQFVSTGRERLFDWMKDLSTVNRFSVTLTEAGSSIDVPCNNTKDFKLPVDVWGDDGWLRCEAGVSEYTFNPTANRFMKAYLLGYVSGTDNNDDTPAITIGVCTKIN
jgi:hypothetical protein